MLFLLIIGLFFVAIVFFHMIQGFFSATLSAILTIISAVLAFSLHETVVEKLLAGKMADYVHAVVLLALFGIIYLILRSIFDNVVKGNVRVPNALDKAGAVVMGLIAAAFATGIMAIAAEELPYTTTIGGFGRYDVQQDREVVVPAAHSLDRMVYSELSIHEPGKFGDEGTGHGVPIIPVDSVVVGAVEKLSNGVFNDGKPLQEIHPDYLDELFGQRMGIEPGANHVAMNLPDKRLEAMDVLGLYDELIPEANQKDAEFEKLRTGGRLKPIPITPSSKDMFLVIRVAFKIQASDQADHIVRFSPGSVRLVAPAAGGDNGGSDFVNYYPVGTMQNASLLFLNKLDDYLFTPPISDHDLGVDLVFKVPRSEFEKKAPPGTFIEFKRLARVDLSGQEVQPGVDLKKNPDFNPQRKPLVLEAAMATPSQQSSTPEAAPAQEAAPAPAAAAPSAGSTPAPAPAAAANTSGKVEVTVSNSIPVAVTAPAGADGQFATVPGGNANISGGKLKTGTIDSTAAEQTQPVKVTQFAVPEGQVMVQVSLPLSAATPWQFNNEPDQYELVDSANKKYQPNGVFAIYDKGGDRFYLRYVDNTSISGGAPPADAAPPKQAVLLYLVPANTTLKQFDDHGKKAQDLNVVAK
jgi:hypothetical protein